MKKSLLFLVLTISLFVNTGIAQPQKQTFTIGNKEFLLNGKPYIIRAAELHYARIPKQYWEQRIQLCKAMGMNTICIYLFWNSHEQKQDQFDFSGQNNIAEFVRLTQKNGMYCIVRPGPYACAEWDMGGLPWWLLKKKDLKVRDISDSFFMERAKKFIGEAGKQLAPLQIQNGGNIIMVQVENEYAAYGSDGTYMADIRDIVKSAFDKVQLFRCDWSSNFNKYKVDGVATTLNFGAGANIDKEFKKFQEVYPTAPLMCSEYWTGWFDHWGKPHETRSVDSFIGSLKEMMDRKISFSLYMAHGGTSFGQWGGANAAPYSAMVSSYDYNAPIGEQGNTTEKFFAIRDLLKNYLQEGETLADIPAAMPVIEIPSFELKESASLFENLPVSNKTENIQPMESFDQGWGRILYRTKIAASSTKQKLVITEVHDWATVFINGTIIGKLDRRKGETTLEIPVQTENAQLDILVEATGRVNFGKGIVDPKGITEKVELVNGTSTTNIKNWEVFNFPVDYAFQKNVKYTAKTSNKPGWYKGTFNLTKTGDTFLDMSTWGKGMVWVNGYNLGRFWKIGPQQTLFIPGAWLKKKNEIIVLDVDSPTSPKVSGLSHSIVDKINIDESLFNKKPGQKVDLAAEIPVHKGSFGSENGWKETSFSTPATGKFFCLETLNSQKADDSLSTLAELELIGVDGKIIPVLKWKIVFASSEETTSGNQTADKVFDQQESTYWQTQSAGGKPPHPHQIIIDLGQEETIKGFRYLHRFDNKPQGMIKDYLVYLKSEPFKL